jgi:large subunit ribosomal protein L25
MKANIVLKSINRKDMNSRENSRLRKSGFVPGSISTKGADSVSIVVRNDEFRNILAKNGRSAIIQLVLDDKRTFSAMVKNTKKDPRNGEYMHIDFQHISLLEETKADVAIKIEGKDVLEAHRLSYVQHMNTIEVKGLPENIPNAIEIDVSGMKAGDNMDIGDIKFPEGVTADMSPDHVVFSVSQPKAVEEAEEVKAAAEPEKAEAPEVTEEKAE